MKQGDKALKIINIIIVFTFIIAPFLLASNFFIQAEYGLGVTFTGMLIVFSYLYWKFGVSYFEVKWLQNLKTQE